jgi:hypothetical protein
MAARFVLDLPEPSPSALCPRTAGTHPAPAFRRACAQCVLPPLMGFGFPSAFPIARSVRAQLDCTSSRARAGPPGPAVCASAVSTTLTLCSACDLAESTSSSAPLLGFFSAEPARRTKKPRWAGDVCSTSTATSTLASLRPRIPQTSRARFGNQRSALRACLTFDLRPSLVRRRARPLVPLQGLSPPGATDLHPSPPSCFASPPRLDRDRSTHRPRTERSGEEVHLGVFTLR